MNYLKLENIHGRVHSLTLAKEDSKATHRKQETHFRKFQPVAAHHTQDLYDSRLWKRIVFYVFMIKKWADVQIVPITAQERQAYHWKWNQTSLGVKPKMLRLMNVS